MAGLFTVNSHPGRTSAGPGRSRGSWRTGQSRISRRKALFDVRRDSPARAPTVSFSLPRPVDAGTSANGWTSRWHTSGMCERNC